jgi:histidine triad (HIT) family protein
MAGECIFCKIAAGEVPAEKIYEDDSLIAFLDISPISPGHTLIIPKRHYSRLDECPEEVIGDLASKLGLIAGAVAQAGDYAGYNIFCNTGRAAGQVVDHVHFHIVGRHPGDKVFDRWPSGRYEEGRMEEMAGKIRKTLSGP